MLFWATTKKNKYLGREHVPGQNRVTPFADILVSRARGKQILGRSGAVYA